MDVILTREEEITKLRALADSLGLSGLIEHVDPVRVHTPQLREMIVACQNAQRRLMAALGVDSSGDPVVPM